MILEASTRRLRSLAVLLVWLVPSVASAQTTGLQRADPVAPADARPNILRDVRFEQRLDDQIPLDLEFTNERGERVKLGSYFGERPVILALVYYECPMLCTQVLTGLVSALGVLQFSVGKEFDVIAVSFDPGEGPGLASAKKDAYVARYDRPGTEQGWHFLTGSEASITALTDAVGFHYKYDRAIDQFAHAAGVTLLTPGGRIARYFFGIEYSPRDLRFGVLEASENRIGSPIDQVLLYCYHYDPSTGTYGFVALSLVRAGGVATILAMATFWIVMWRRERRAEAPTARTVRGRV
jgi:protein SCO1